MKCLFLLKLVNQNKTFLIKRKKTPEIAITAENLKKKINKI